MFNPFSEVAESGSTDADLVEQVRNGDRAALEQLVLRHQAWVYNIAVRMVFHLHDAEEVTQEVLVKAVTRLSTFRGESTFRTWLYRIAANHVLNMKRRGGEVRPQTFASYAAAINNTPDLDLPYPKSVPVDVPLLVEEAKLTCTTGMLLCLDRKQRLIFALGEIFGVSDTVGGEILEMSAANFRQSLARARRDLYQFMHGQCGLVNADNPCRCPKKTRGSSPTVTSIPITCFSFPCTSDASARRRPIPFAMSKAFSISSTRPSIANIRFSSPRTKSAGFVRSWTDPMSAPPCTSIEAIPLKLSQSVTGRVYGVGKATITTNRRGHDHA